jgi:hypothetical protein
MRRVFAVVVGVEAAYLAVMGALRVLDLDTGFRGWVLVPVFAVVWPLVFASAAYVLWREKLAASLVEAWARAGVVTVVVVANLLLVWAAVTRPEVVF